MSTPLPPNETNSQTSTNRENVIAEVAAYLQNQGPTAVRERLINELTEREINKRVGLLDNALDKRKQLDRDVKKIKPEEQFTADGEKLPGVFNKQKLEERKKAVEKLGKLDAAIEKAFNGNFEQLEQLISNKEQD